MAQLSLKQSIDANIVLLGQGSAAITAEETRALAAESQVASDLSDEISDRAAAITAEVVNRDAAVAVETARATSAESALDTAVGDEVADLIAAVSAEVSARNAAIAVSDARAVAEKA